MHPIIYLLFPAAFVIALGFLLQHFLSALAWAGLLAVITWPLHVKLESRGWPRMASAAIVVITLVTSFGVPAYFLLDSLSREVLTAKALLERLNRTGLPAPEWISELPFFSAVVTEWWNEHLAMPGGLNAVIGTTLGDITPYLTTTVSSLGSSVLANALYLFLALLTLFVVLSEGPAVVRYVDNAGRRLLPRHYQVLRTLFPLSVRGTALGLCSVAVLEGVVLGVAYAIAGAPMPALLGLITAYMALIPGGAPLSFSLVSAFLFAQGQPGAALGLFAWGSFELFMVDKFVRPKLIGHRVQLPFLAVLFGLLGGVSTIGVLGLFIGPFLMAVLFWWLRGGHDGAPSTTELAPADVTAIRHKDAA